MVSEENKKRMDEMKIGDKVVLIKSNNGSALVNKVLVVTSKSGCDSFVVKDENNLTTRIYNTSPADTWEFATREIMLEQLNKRKNDLMGDIKKIDEEIEYHTKYSSEEEYLADKFSKMLKKPTKENIQNILESMRKMNNL